MKKMVIILLGCIIVSVVGAPYAASMLGVSTYAATKVVDAIMAGMSIWAVAGIVAVSGGAMGVVWYGVKSLIKRVGRRFCDCVVAN